MAASDPEVLEKIRAELARLADALEARASPLGPASTEAQPTAQKMKPTLATARIFPEAVREGATVTSGFTVEVGRPVPKTK